MSLTSYLYTPPSLLSATIFHSATHYFSLFPVLSEFLEDS